MVINLAHGLSTVINLVVLFSVTKWIIPSISELELLDDSDDDEELLELLDSEEELELDELISANCTPHKSV